MLPQATLRNQFYAHSNLVSHSLDLNAFLGFTDLSYVCQMVAIQKTLIFLRKNNDFQDVLA